MTMTTLDLPPSPHLPRRQLWRPLKNAKGNSEQATTTSTERAERVWQLRLAGWTWQSIAESPHFSNRSAAHQVAIRYALLVNLSNEAAREATRMRMLGQFDLIVSRIEPDPTRCTAPERREVAMERALRPIEAQKRWLGLATSATPLAQRLPRHGLTVKDAVKDAVKP